MAQPVLGLPFDPANWYWIVGDNTTQVYSSAKKSDQSGPVGYVPLRDQAYVDWVTRGGIASHIGSEQELWDYLNGRVVNGTPPEAVSTDAAKEQRIVEQLNEVIYQIAYSHESRLRTLERLPEITQEQFIDRVKGIMK